MERRGEDGEGGEQCAAYVCGEMGGLLRALKHEEAQDEEAAEGDESGTEGECDELHYVGVAVVWTL